MNWKVIQRYSACGDLQDTQQGCTTCKPKVPFPVRLHTETCSTVIVPCKRCALVPFIA